MRTLYHWPLDPQSRQARIALTEKKLRFKLELLNPWEPDEAFFELCPEGIPPCLVDVVAGGNAVITGARAICEYAEEGSSRFPLMSGNALERAETRRLCNWFDTKFADEVNAYLMHERVEKALSGGGAPHPPNLREGREHLMHHLTYMTWLLEKRDWMAGKSFSLADIAAGANISCLDFIGEVRWRNWPILTDWYQKLKSRPSFQPLLADRVPGIIAPAHYADLDF